MVIDEPRSAPFLLNLLTAPSAPAKEREHYLMAQPPRLGKAGNVRSMRLYVAKPIQRDTHLQAHKTYATTR